MTGRANRIDLLSAPRLLPLSTGDSLAYHQLPGTALGLLFCGGYTSDMNGTKALALAAYCRARGRAFTRFDYRGHGASSGRLSARGATSRRGADRRRLEQGRLDHAAAGRSHGPRASTV
jgi:pimeloyl-ACP methyl ester carboxylesterase